MRILIFFLDAIFTSDIIANEELLIDQFFGKSGIKDKKSVYSGEMITHLNRPTLGESLPTGVNRQYRLIEKTKHSAIYAVLLSKDDKTQDWYIYLVNENNSWKISAIRNLALPGLFFIVLQELSNKEKRTKEEEIQYQNMSLTIKSDLFLKNYLKDNITVFNQIAKLSKSNLTAANKLAKTIHLNYVELNKVTSVIDINIGGMIDNSVGYMFIPVGAKLPKISTDHYIYIEKVKDQWYLYKTT